MDPTNLLALGLSNALAAAALAVLVAAVTLPFRRRRPALVHALWLLVLLKLVTPPVWNVPVHLAAPQSATPRAEARVVVQDVEIEYVYLDELPPPVAPPAATPEPMDWARVATGAAAAVWAAGSLACLALIVSRSVRFHRLLRHAALATPEVARRVRAVADRVGLSNPPAAWLVPGAVCPMLYAAFGRPRLLLPQGLWDRLDDDERDTLIAHELAHLRRRDHWVRLVEVAATVLYWWLPVLWWARRELREAEEQCCDAWVVWSMPAAVRDYMRAILEAVEYVSEPNPGGGTPAPGHSPFAPAAVPALASGMGEFRRLERRLWMIRRSDSPHRLSRPGFLAVVLGAAALPFAPTLADPDTPDAPGADTVERREIVVSPLTQTTTEGKPADVRGEVATEVRTTLEPVRVESDVVITHDGETTTVVGDEFNFGSSDDAPANIIVDARTGKKIEVRGKTVRVVNGDELEEARAAVERARADLAAAQNRLDMLERSARGDGKGEAKGGTRGPDKASVKFGVIARTKPTEAQNKNPYMKEKPNYKNADGDPEPRIRQLEEKLDKIDAMLNEIRQQTKGDRDGGKADTTTNLRRF